MTNEPALVILSYASLAAVASLAANRCLFFAQLIEKNAAIDLSLYDYMQDLADGAERLVDQIPNGAGADLSTRVCRLHNALEARNRKAAA